MNLCEQDWVCIFVLLYYCFGMVMGNLVCLIQGVVVILLSEVFDFEIVLEIVEVECCIVLYGVFIMFIVELEMLNFDEFDFSFLCIGIMVGSFCFVDVMCNVIF